MCNQLLAHPLPPGSADNIPHEEGGSGRAKFHIFSLSSEVQSNRLAGSLPAGGQVKSLYRVQR